MVKGLADALGLLVGMPIERSLATNSLMLRFDFREREKGRAYLWIDPPWRLTFNRIYLTGSADWPDWDGVTEPEVNQPLWKAWCALFDPLNETTLAGFGVGEPLPDLRLRFASGYKLETFGDSGRDYWWYYRDRVSGEVFEAGPAGVTRESGRPAAD